jgi:hypothetical protein
MLRKSGSGPTAKLNDLLLLGQLGLGQSCPQQYTHPGHGQSIAIIEPLGLPLSIRQVATLIGCSPWTVRHKYVPAGLPHLRIGPNGKLIFYRNQVIHWLLTQQEKGGITR